MGKSRLFHLFPYAPDRNPGELAWKRPKAGTVGRMVTTGKAGFNTKVVSSIRSL